MKTKPVNDMYLVAALLSYGAKLDSVDRENPKRQIFYFVDSRIIVWEKISENIITQVEFADLEQVELLFRSKRLMFLPDYHNFIRDTKSMIHAR